ncbi:BTB/POZ domain-containing protein 9-like [Contarinia nasturtii]|uniref:BTB/POZ domain-containing protein 9-like n=1 Tax=Contarinia nasturtii TaxID=265458 RepID=UPI0012D4A7AB|nr:BTB/POZ domain-containing protein 9-like [Contarinia nasturtii]
MSDFKPIAPKYDSKLFAAIGEELYLSSDLADVYFVFESKNKPNVRVPAHKILLQKGCDAFRAMFNGSWKEKNEVRIVDTPASAFKEFLQFFYKVEVVLTKENVGAVMNLAKQYVMDECVTMCVKFLKNTLNESNVCTRYGMAILYEQVELKKSCETIIGLKANSMFKSADFLSCDRNILAAILGLDWLTCSEVELFEACMAWVKAASKQEVLTTEAVQDHLGDLLYKIRFGAMSMNEFGVLVPSYGKAFSADDYQEIIQIILDEDFKATIFNGKRVKRCEIEPWHYKHIFCNREFSESDSVDPYFLQNIETTKFSVNQPLLLYAFICDHLRLFRDGKYYEMDEELPTKFTIVEVAHSGSTNEEVELYNGDAYLEYICTVVSVSNPIFIRPGFHYEIRMKLDPPVDCCIGSLLQSEVHINDITVQFHDDGDNESSNFIWELRFYKI